MQILIAEDDRISEMVLRKTLIKLGHEVTTAQTGAQAWTLVQSGDFRLVISDWMMPEMDGVDLCRHIRGMSAGTYIYVILLTAKCSREDRLEAMDAGVMFTR